MNLRPRETLKKPVRYVPSTTIEQIKDDVTITTETTTTSTSVSTMDEYEIGSFVVSDDEED